MLLKFRTSHDEITPGFLFEFQILSHVTICHPGKNDHRKIPFVCNFFAFLGNHHPSLEFDCSKAVLVIRRVCLCAGMHAWALHI